MRYLPRLLSSMMVLWLGVAPALAAPTIGAASTGKPIPPFDQVKKSVLQYFEKIPNYRARDLITQKEVAPLLNQLQKEGLPLDAKKILKKVPAEGEFLVNQLSTPKGRRFMRRVAAYPDAYDRLDRLSRLPQGRQTVRMLVGDPHGERMIEYMTTSKGGKELGKMLSKGPGGANFNAPTGRLYTASLLLDELQKSRAAAVKAAEKSGKN